MDADKEYAQSLMKFWERHFNEIDRTQFEKSDMPESLGEWLYDIEHYRDVRHWSIMNAAWLGLGWYKGDRQNLPCRFNEENKKVPEGYFLWDYDGEQFLVSLDTYEAYRTRKVEKVIRYEMYEPINE